MVALGLVGLVASDTWAGGPEGYWTRHGLTGSIVSNLFAVAVTGLIIDELIAHRQRRARAVSVAAQALVVYTQARYLCDAVTTVEGPDARQAIGENLRSLANMLLVASPEFFDDPPAQRFLVQVQRFTASVFQALGSPASGPLDRGARERVAADMARLASEAEPLVRRLPADPLAIGGTRAAG
jgi:hypothetical protein